MKVLETKTCVDKQMDEMQREREQTLEDIWTRLNNSAETKDLDILRQDDDGCGVSKRQL